MIKKTLILKYFSAVVVFVSVVGFSSCQKEQSIVKKEVNISNEELEMLANNLVATNLSDEEITKTVSLFKTLSTDDYKTFIHYQARVMARVNDIPFEVALQDRERLLSESIYKFGKSPNQLSDVEIELIVPSVKNSQSKLASSCPQYYHGIVTQQYSTYNTSCYAVWDATDPGQTDCDYELVFYVGPATLASPYKIRGISVTARNILSIGGVNGRQSGEYVYILVGKNRSNALYYAVGIQDEVQALKAEMKLQK
ncbi:hypothetical protein SAMN05421780_1232 [Flexibacter flexilis DSM 6793]|uniref:Uncharacterized protein n=1 Tax=Flexibacter flexilis DSM 6793 TaxID=927664 RepID=A0A1I1P504_9BACT|nr:hypothetical protein [Flexibacter flexilis]SFD02063.1 hypothetical protein SAMN05421780_1232 [Flexibacter flexilis DSM 6793]